MKFAPLLIGIAITQMLSVSAQAAEPGPQAPATTYVKPTPEEKSAARAARKQAGKQANADRPSEPDVRFPPVAVKVDPAEKQAARAERKKETRRALKAGEVEVQGEVGAKR